MVSFRNFALFLIMCCLTGSTYSLKPKEITKKDTKKGTGEGSGATTPSPSPVHVPNVAAADKDAEADTPEKKAEQKAALEAMYGGSMYADNTNGATTPSPGPVHNPKGMYGESGTGTNIPVSSDKDSDEKLKLPKGSENMYAGDGDDHGDMTESNSYNGPTHDGAVHDSKANNGASGTGTTETTTRYTTPSEKDSGEKPSEKIKLSDQAENMYTDTQDDDAAHSLPYNPKGVNGASSDKDSDEKLKLPEGQENLYADDGFKPYDGPVHNPDGMYDESGTGTKLDGKGDSDSDAEKKDSDSDAEKKTANNGVDTTYDDNGNAHAKVPAHEANVAAGADKDADSDEKVDLYGSDSIYNQVYGDQSNEKPTPFGVYEGATCFAGFEPIMSSWQDCKLAAVALNITGDSIGHVDYYTQKGSQAFGTDVPQGCFRDAVTNRVYFNPGKGGSGRKENDQNKWSDRVVCRQTNADYSYTYGKTCLDGYLPITTSADDCASAAEWLGLSTGMVAHTADNPCKMGDGIICRMDYDPSKHTEL